MAQQDAGGQQSQGRGIWGAGIMHLWRLSSWDGCWGSRPLRTNGLGLSVSVFKPQGPQQEQ